MEPARARKDPEPVHATRSIAAAMDPWRLKNLAAQFETKNILVVGDLMLDQFIWGDATHISPEAPIPVVKVSSESFMPGGAANVVNNICAVGGKAAITGVVGEDDSGKKILELLKTEGADVSGVIVCADQSSVVKTRIIARHQHVVRVDRDMTVRGDGELRRRMLAAIEESIDNFDAVVLEDYGKGVLTEPLVESIIDLCRKKDKILTADPKIDHYLDYSGATLVTPNYAEAVAISGLAQNRDAGLDSIAKRLHEKWRGCNILITLGERGMYLSNSDESAVHIPTRARDVYDVAGAGDTVIAIITLALACGASIEEAATVANLAAGVVVGKIGTGTLDREELIKAGEES